MEKLGVRPLDPQPFLIRLVGVLEAGAENGKPILVPLLKQLIRLLEVGERLHPHRGVFRELGELEVERGWSKADGCCQHEPG